MQTTTTTAFRRPRHVPFTVSPTAHRPATTAIQASLARHRAYPCPLCGYAILGCTEGVCYAPCQDECELPTQEYLDEVNTEARTGYHPGNPGTAVDQLQHLVGRVAHILPHSGQYSEGHCNTGVVLRVEAYEGDPECPDIWVGLHEVRGHDGERRYTVEVSVLVGDIDVE